MEKKNNKNSSIERKNKNRNKKKIEKFKLSMFRNDDMPSITEVKNQILDAIKHGKHYRSQKPIIIKDQRDLDSLAEILSCAFEKSEESIEIFSCFHPEFWNKFKNIFEKKGRAGVKLRFYIDPRVNIEILRKELPWLFDFGDVFLVLSNKARRHYELVDNGKVFLRIEEFHDYPFSLSEGQEINNNAIVSAKEIPLDIYNAHLWSIPLPLYEHDKNEYDKIIEEYQVKVEDKDRIYKCLAKNGIKPDILKRVLNEISKYVKYDELALDTDIIDEETEISSIWVYSSESDHRLIEQLRKVRESVKSILEKYGLEYRKSLAIIGIAKERSKLITIPIKEEISLDNYIDKRLAELNLNEDEIQAIKNQIDEEINKALTSDKQLAEAIEELAHTIAEYKRVPEDTAKKLAHIIARNILFEILRQDKE